MASFIKKCEICGKSFNYTCGAFTQHLISDHQLSLKEYVIQFEYNGVAPKCACGYCNEEPPFIRGKFLTYIGEHKTYKWNQDQYIKKFGIPHCKKCGKEVGFNRLSPQIYCSQSCISSDNGWNQSKIKETVKKKYGVQNVSQLQDVHIKQNAYKTHFYKNSKIFYRSSYEYDFLQICENLGILNKIKNGNKFNYKEHTYFTDFAIDNYEIEIKSWWILKKQGGLPVLFMKRDVVQEAGKKYIFILDKDYSEFLSIFS